MGPELAYLVLLTLAVVAVELIRWARNAEAHEFNNGICRKCQTRLDHFDNDSQGGRGYTCRQCGRTVWVSYPSVDRDVLAQESGS